MRGGGLAQVVCCDEYWYFTTVPRFVTFAPLMKRVLFTGVGAVLILDFVAHKYHVCILQYNSFPAGLRINMTNFGTSLLTLHWLHTVNMDLT